MKNAKTWVVRPVGSAYYFVEVSVPSFNHSMLNHSMRWERAFTCYSEKNARKVAKMIAEHRGPTDDWGLPIDIIEEFGEDE